MLGGCMIILALLQSCSSTAHEAEASQIKPSTRRSDSCNRSRVAARRPSSQGDRAQARHTDLCNERRQGHSDQAVACRGLVTKPGIRKTGRRALALLLFTLIAAPSFAFDLEGHRGTRGLAPENTLAAFRRALEIGVTTIETDMAVTSDDVVVISHDPFLNPYLVRDPEGHWLASPGPPIRTLTLAELQRYDIGRINPTSQYARQFPNQQAVDGERFPKLSELFDLAKTSGKPVRFNIETKITPTSGTDTPDPATFARLVVAAVRAADVSNRVTVQSFDWRTLLEVKRIAPEIETACLTIQTKDNDTVTSPDGGPSPWHAGLALRDHGGSLPALVKAAGCGTWSMFWRNLTPKDLAAAHALGLKVLPWTVNERGDMRSLIELGVDGIITDYPDRLREVMAEKRMALP
jgi:glycerophosphoryl diester phosphodiesterase